MPGDASCQRQLVADQENAQPGIESVESRVLESPRTAAAVDSARWVLICSVLHILDFIPVCKITRLCWDAALYSLPRQATTLAFSIPCRFRILLTPRRCPFQPYSAYSKNIHQMHARTHSLAPSSLECLSAQTNQPAHLDRVDSG